MNADTVKSSRWQLNEIVKTIPIANLRKYYCQELEDWAHTDTIVRQCAKRVLSEFEVEGDSYGVPMIEDIVELLVKKIESYEKATNK